MNLKKSKLSTFWNGGSSQEQLFWTSIATTESQCLQRIRFINHHKLYSPNRILPLWLITNLDSYHIKYHKEKSVHHLNHTAPKKRVEALIMIHAKCTWWAQGFNSRPVSGNRRAPVPVYRSGLTGYRSKPVEFKFEFKLRRSIGSDRYTGQLDRYTGRFVRYTGRFGW